jgi:hypothetical protein
MIFWSWSLRCRKKSKARGIKLEPEIRVVEKDKEEDRSQESEDRRQEPEEREGNQLG